MEKLVIKNGFIVTLGNKNKVLEGYCICINKGTIDCIVPENRIPSNYNEAKTLDANKKLVMPGMINTHMHLYSTFARGISLTSPPARNFTEILNGLWWRLDKKLTTDDIYYSALIPLIGCIKSGTTTVIDHHASPFAVKGSLTTIAQAYNELGLRGILAYEISNRDGERIADEGINENADFIEKYKNDTMLKGLIGLHAMFTIKDKTLSKISEIAEKSGTGIHIHCCEDRYDRDYNIDKYQLSPVQRLKEFNLLKDTSILAHCIHIDNLDMDIIRDSGSIVVHNPQSNMNNAVGCCKLLDIVNKDILVGLGTDGMTFNMFEELGVANLIHKHVNQNSNVGWCEIESLVTKNNSKIVSRIFNKQIGAIETGAAADIIIVDYDAPTPLHSNNFWGHMLFGINKSKVTTTIANGKILMDNGQLTLSNIDEALINAKSRELSKKFWERF